jgi:hypothetical protein
MSLLAVSNASALVTRTSGSMPISSQPFSGYGLSGATSWVVPDIDDQRGGFVQRSHHPGRRLTADGGIGHPIQLDVADIARQLLDLLEHTVQVTHHGALTLTDRLGHRWRPHLRQRPRAVHHVGDERPARDAERGARAPDLRVDGSRELRGRVERVVVAVLVVRQDQVRQPFADRTIHVALRDVRGDRRHELAPRLGIECHGYRLSGLGRAGGLVSLRQLLEVRGCIRERPRLKQQREGGEHEDRTEPEL